MPDEGLGLLNMYVKGARPFTVIPHNAQKLGGISFYESWLNPGRSFPWAQVLRCAVLSSPASLCLVNTVTALPRFLGSVVTRHECVTSSFVEQKKSNDNPCFGI